MLRDAVPKYLERSPLVGMKRLPIIKRRKRLLRARPKSRGCSRLRPTRRIRRCSSRHRYAGPPGRLAGSAREPIATAPGSRFGTAKSGEPYQIATVAPRGRQKPWMPLRTTGRTTSRSSAARSIRATGGSGVRQRLEYLCRSGRRVPFGRGGITFHWRDPADRGDAVSARAAGAAQRRAEAGQLEASRVLLRISARREDQLAMVGVKGRAARKRVREWSRPCATR